MFLFRTALAEAELEYNAEHVSPSLYFLVDVFAPRLADFVGSGGNVPVRAVVWTTTPWTLPATEAVAFRSDVDYVVVEGVSEGSGGATGRFLVAEQTLERVAAETGRAFGRVLARFPGIWVFGGRRASRSRLIFSSSSWFFKRESLLIDEDVCL